MAKGKKKESVTGRITFELPLDKKNAFTDKSLSIGANPSSLLRQMIYQFIDEK